MRHDVAKSDRLAESRGNLEVEIVVYVQVEIEFSLLDKLHHRSPSKKLRDGAGTKECIPRRDGFALLQVGISVTLCKENVAILDHGNDCTRDVFALDLGRQKPIQKGFEVRRSKRMGDIFGRLTCCFLLRRDLGGHGLRFLRRLCER